MMLLLPGLLLLSSSGYLSAQTKLRENDNREIHEDPSAREKLRYLQRADEHGQIVFGALLNAKQQIDAMAAKSKLRVRTPEDAGIWNWEWLGPGNIGGRIRTILIDPTSPIVTKMWIGSASGGIWKTDNGGDSWYPVDDFMANLAVTSMVMDPTNTNVLYAATGEGFSKFADRLQGAGIFKSTDGGVTWFRLANTNNPNFRWVNRLTHHPTSSNILLAGTADSGAGGYGEPSPANTGKIWRTTNGGSTWDTVFTSSSIVSDVKYHPSNGNLIMVGTFSDLYLSTNGGNTWIRQTTGGSMLPLSPSRCEVAFSQSNPSILYTHIDRNQGEVWRSTNQGGSWSLQGVDASLSTQGQYDNAIWVDPTNSNFLIVAGRNLQRSTDGGQTFTLLGGYSGVSVPNVHADIHAIVSHPQFNGGTNKIVFVGCDGGIYGTTDIQTVSTSSGWQNLNNNLGITQFYGGAAATDGSLIAGGAQDNDRLHYTPARGVNGWYGATGGNAPGGDGTASAIDFTNPQRVYMEATGLSVQRSDDGGSTYNMKVNGISDVGAWVSPLVMDPNNATTLVAGGTKIWRTTDAADNWNLIKGTIPGASKCSAIDIATGNSSIIWVGYANGTVSRTTNGGGSGGSWTDVQGNPTALPNRYITDIAINPTNSNEVFVTVGGYNSNSVWFTGNNGITWQPRFGSGANTLPAIQVNTIRFHPLNTNWIYIGTDLGIFASEDKGLTWSITPRFAGNEGPVNVEVDELFWQGSEYLIAATHGRGMFRCRPLAVAWVDVSNPNPGDGTLLNPYNTIAAGISAAGPGTQIVVRTGTYNEGQLTFNKRGTVGTINGPVIIK